MDPRVGFGALNGGYLLEFLPTFFESCEKLGRVEGKVLVERNPLIDAALENTVQRVIVLGGYRVEFMIVASRASDGEPHQTAEHRVDPILDDVRGNREEATSQGQKPHGRKIGGALVDQLIRGDLQQDKSVIRQILIECVDHPIAVCRSKHKRSLFPAINVALGVGVPSDIEPNSTPAFAVGFVRQQPIDRLLPSIRT